MTRLEALGPWPARVLWIALALVAGGCVGDALDGRSSAVVIVALVGLWAGWAGGLVALLVPRSTSLTALRIVVPGAVVALGAAALAGSATDGADLAALVVAALAVVAVFVPWVGEAWVGGSAYGAEVRLPLRPPAALTYALAPITWLAVLAGAAAGPLLLAAGQWVAGGVALVVGFPVAAAGVRSLHQLARRWVVLVPSGFVLHDPLAMPEPQLFLRASIAGLGPAEADTTADDLSAGAPGLALELVLAEPVDLLVRGQGRTTATRTASAVLFTPSRPSRVLDAARTNRIPVR